MCACFASDGYTGCTRWRRSPSIIRETRGAWRVVVGGKAKLETEFAIDLRIGFSLQRSLVPSGTPRRLTSMGGSRFCAVINFVWRELGFITTSGVMAA